MWVTGTHIFPFSQNKSRELDWKWSGPDEQVPIWDAGLSGSSFTHHATIQSCICYFVLKSLKMKSTILRYVLAFSFLILDLL